MACDICKGSPIQIYKFAGGPRFPTIAFVPFRVKMIGRTPLERRGILEVHLNQRSQPLAHFKRDMLALPAEKVEWLQILPDCLSTGRLLTSRPAGQPQPSPDQGFIPVAAPKTEGSRGSPRKANRSNFHTPMIARAVECHHGLSQTTSTVADTATNTGNQSQ